MEKITATFIFEEVQKLIEAKIPVPKEDWLKIAFKLDVLRLDEARSFNIMRQKVAEMKFAIYEKQDKKNVAACEMEVEKSDQYRFMKDQEALLYSIDELIRVAKKSADVNF